MSGLNNDGDEALDNVDSLISMIKGNKKNEAAQNSQDPDARPQTAPAGDSPASRIGDFDALRKKMNESKKEEPAPFVNEPSVPKRTGSPASQFDDLEFSDADDLQDKPPQSPRTPQVSPAEPDNLMGGRDVRESLGKLLAGKETSPSPASPPDNAKTKEQEVIEIIDDDPRAAVRTKSVKTASAEPQAAMEPVTDADKKIINVDQISELSGLILPKGVSFKIDELKLHGRISAFEGTGTLPPDFDEIWKKNFSTARLQGPGHCLRNRVGSTENADRTEKIRSVPAFQGGSRHS